ncbi:MAG TPA: VWA domain-containing protein [Pyrinomonadaceae bacterium]|nr:VWA domain-containing protein [Pyrinomonadaceae bacterium]
MASGNKRRDSGAADGRALTRGRTAEPARGCRSRLAAAWLCGALALLVAFAPAPYAGGAQSGRKKTPQPPAEQGRGIRPGPSPTPGPIAEPPRTEKKKADDSLTVIRSEGERARPLPASSPTPAAAAESGSGEEVDEDEVVRISSNLVPVPATVIDDRGRAVTDLQLKDFELVVDGETRPIAELTRSETPVRIALLYDNSSSLRAGREFEKQAAVRFLKTVLRPVDRAAIFSVSTVPELSQPLTNDVRALVRTIESFNKPEGATALFDAVAQAADYLRPHEGRKVIVIVSDGTDTISDLDFETTVERAVANDCQIYAVQTGHSESANLRDLRGERNLQFFAEQTGGAVYVPRTGSDLSDAFAQIAADLAQQYVLHYYPADARRDGRFHPFTLRVTSRQNLRVRTRRGYYSPKG